VERKSLGNHARGILINAMPPDVIFMAALAVSMRKRLGKNIANKPEVF
jgi:hypothetical protein